MKNLKGFFQNFNNPLNFFTSKNFNKILFTLQKKPKPCDEHQQNKLISVLNNESIKEIFKYKKYVPQNCNRRKEEKYENCLHLMFRIAGTRKSIFMSIFKYKNRLYYDVDDDDDDYYVCFCCCGCCCCLVNRIRVVH